MSDHFGRTKFEFKRFFVFAVLFYWLSLTLTTDVSGFQGYSAGFSGRSQENFGNFPKQLTPGSADPSVPAFIPASPDEKFFTSSDERPSPQAATSYDSFRVRHGQSNDHFERPRAMPVQVDDSIRLTNFNSPMEPANPKETPKKIALEWIERYSVDQSDQELPGRPMMLLELMESPASKQRRFEMVNQYWETWMRWSRLQSCIRYRQWLGQLGPASSNHDSNLLQLAQAAVDTEIAAARIDLQRAQIKLAQYVPANSRNGESGQSQLPLPADLPLVQSYTTKSEIYQQHRKLPARLSNIDSILAETLKLINEQATVSQLGQTAVDSMQTAYRNQQTHLGSLLEAGRIWRKSEESLITSVTNYNRMIADYSMSVTDGTQSPEVATAMLIVRPKRDSFPQESSDSSNQVAGFEQPWSQNRGFDQPVSESGQIQVPDHANLWGPAETSPVTSKNPPAIERPNGSQELNRSSDFSSSSQMPTASGNRRSGSEPSRIEDTHARPPVPTIPRDFSSDFGSQRPSGSEDKQPTSNSLQEDPAAANPAGQMKVEPFSPFRPLPNNAEETVRPIMPPDDGPPKFNPLPQPLNDRPVQETDATEFNPFR